MAYKTRVRLYDNVPFSNNYQDTRWFDNRAQQESYFNRLSPKVINVNDNRYVKIDEGFMHVADATRNIERYNYVEITNNTSEGADMTYYAFVNEITRQSGNQLKITFTIDVIQTFMFNLNFKKSFVERAHMPRWKSGSIPNINNAPESVNLGNEYETVSIRQWQRNIDTYFNTVLVMATSSLSEASTGNSVGGSMYGGSISPLQYYLMLIPKKQSPLYQVNFNGEALYQTPASGQNGGSMMPDILEVFKIFNDEDTANKIVGMSYLPFFPFPANATETSSVGILSYAVNVDNKYCYPTQVTKTKQYKIIGVRAHTGVGLGTVLSENFYSTVKSSYDNIGVTESKLLMYPYSVATFYDGQGGVFEIKPQLTRDGAINVNAFATLSSNPKSGYTFGNYAGRDDMTNTLIGGVSAEIEVINNHLATYLQGNKNSEKNAMAQGVTSSLLQTATGIGLGVFGGMTSNPMALASGVGVATSGLTNGFFGVNSALAKREDIKNIPPNVSSHVNSGNIGIAFDRTRPYIEFKRVSDDTAKQINSYFKMYGVSVNQLMTVPLKTRTNYNFVKTVGLNVTGKIPTFYMNEVKRIFDNGITLWHVDDIYNYDVSNNER